MSRTIILCFALSTALVFAVDERYETLSAGDAVYTNTVVTSVMSDRLVISHSRGIATIRISELKPDLRYKYMEEASRKTGEAKERTRASATRSDLKILEARTSNAEDPELDPQPFHVITNSHLKYSIVVSNSYILSAADKREWITEAERWANKQKIEFMPFSIADGWVNIAPTKQTAPIAVAIVSLSYERAPSELARSSLNRLRNVQGAKEVSSFELTYQSTPVSVVRATLVEDGEDVIAFCAFLPLSPKAVMLAVTGRAEDEEQVSAELVSIFTRLQGKVSSRPPLFGDGSISRLGWRLIGEWSLATAFVIGTFVFFWRKCLRGSSMD